MIEPQWIILAADALITLSATLNSLALGRIGRMTPTKHTPNTGYPSITVVVSAHNQIEELKKHLPSLLLQDYPAPFEVVVVDMASDDGTCKMLERMEEDYPTLRHTFTPITARDISLERLALTLGIRSASYPWTILLQAGCRPVGPHWLRRMGESMTKESTTEIVVAPVCPAAAEKTDDYTPIWKELLWLSYAVKNAAYRTGQCNVAYKQQLFMRHQGFASHAQLAGGAIDIMVNQHSNATNTAVNIRPECMMLYTPLTNTCDADLLYMETRRHLSRNRFFRVQYFLVATALPTALCVGITTIGWMAWQKQWWLLAAAGLILLMHWAVYHRSYSRSVYKLGLRTPHPWTHLRALMIPWSDVCAWARHKMTSHNTFRKKFV